MATQSTNLRISAVPSGNLGHEEVLKLLSESEIYIGHSLSDGISTSMLEAMAMGAVPIQTRGIIIGRLGGTVVNGEPVQSNGADDFIPLAAVSGEVVATVITQAIKLKCGRAWSDGTSGGYALIELTP